MSASCPGPIRRASPYQDFKTIGGGLIAGESLAALGLGLYCLIGTLLSKQ